MDENNLTETAQSNLNVTVLKPCPFCEGEAISHYIEPHKHYIATFMPDYDGEWFIECLSCGIAIAGETEHEAAEKWNGRIQETKAAEQLMKYQNAHEAIKERVKEIKASINYPHNFMGQIVEDLEWVLGLFN